MATITYVDDTADAGQTDFPFSFDYLEEEHVTVFIDGVQQTIGATEDYTVQTSPTKKIVLNVAATGGEIVRVRRISDPATDLVDFENGSVLTESELDRAYLHNRYLAEESAEQNDISLRVKEGGGGFDGLNKRLLNLSDPVDTQDAATKNYVDTNDALKVSKAGDSMSGDLAMGSNKITGLSNPSDDQDAATKDYVDDVIGDVAVGSLPDDSVTYAKIQEVASNNVLLGNDNGTNQNIQELSATEARALLNVADGATANTGTVTLINTGTGLIGGPISASGEISIGTAGVGETQLAPGAVTSGKISDTDANFNINTSTNNVGINTLAGVHKFTVNGDVLVQDTTGDNFPVAIFAGTAGGGIQLLDSGTGGQVYNIASSKDLQGRGNLSVGHIASAGSPLAIIDPATITDPADPAKPSNWTTTLATFSTSSAHGLTEGQYGGLSGGATDWNQAVEVVDVPSTTTFVVPKLSTSTDYPDTFTPNETYVPLLIRRHTESSTLSTMIKLVGLPKDIDNGGVAGTQPSWLEAGQLWIDTTDNSIKINPETTT